LNKSVKNEPNAIILMYRVLRYSKNKKLSLFETLDVHPFFKHFLILE